jgi:hypothetical protein
MPTRIRAKNILRMLTKQSARCSDPNNAQKIKAGQCKLNTSAIAPNTIAETDIAARKIVGTDRRFMRFLSIPTLAGGSLDRWARIMDVIDEIEVPLHHLTQRPATLRNGALNLNGRLGLLLSRQADFHTVGGCNTSPLAATDAAGIMSRHTSVGLTLA